MLVAAALAVLFAAYVERASAQGVTSQKTAALQQANSLFNAEKWAQAAAVFEEITKSEPSNGLAWFRLGQSLHALGEYRRAIEAYEQAQKVQFNPIGVLYRTARAYARLGEKARALELLGNAADAGLPESVITSDAELESLAAEPKYKDVLYRAKRASKPCEYDSRFRQFDFWIGEWDVKPAQALEGPPVGESSITRAADGCIVLENWTGAKGGSGKSLNFYNRASGQWQQTWVGSDSTVLEYHGEYKDGAMRFEAETAGANGTRINNKLTFFNLSPDRVRQLAETSSDGGKSWSTRYDFIYLRKK
jgi:tetratricopeptide (TPR) repeat protein